MRVFAFKSSRVYLAPRAPPSVRGGGGVPERRMHAAPPHSRHHCQPARRPGMIPPVLAMIHGPLLLLHPPPFEKCAAQTVSPAPAVSRLHCLDFHRRAPLTSPLMHSGCIPHRQVPPPLPPPSWPRGGGAVKDTRGSQTTHPLWSAPRSLSRPCPNRCDGCARGGGGRSTTEPGIYTRTRRDAGAPSLPAREGGGEGRRRYAMRCPPPRVSPVAVARRRGEG